MRDGDFELINLKNGVRAVRHIGHGEVMHPAEGPWLEANRLYVEQPGLGQRLQSACASPVIIFDIGLGAATNAVAALTCARQVGGTVEVHSFERDLAPLRLALGDCDGFPFLVPWREAAHTLMARGQWSGPEGRWLLHHGNLLDRLADVSARAELVYYDPFSPENNSALWTPAAFAAILACCRRDGEGTLLLTYSTATPVRVSLLLGGFYVGVGFSTGNKRETTVGATCKKALCQPLGARFLARWERSTARAPIGESVLTAEHEHALRSHRQFAGEED